MQKGQAEGWANADFFYYRLGLGLKKLKKACNVNCKLL